jgi:hypothetical protein
MSLGLLTLVALLLRYRLRSKCCSKASALLMSAAASQVADNNRALTRPQPSTTNTPQTANDKHQPRPQIRRRPRGETVQPGQGEAHCPGAAVK